MNDETPGQRELTSLEMRLAAHPPRISQAEKDALLYSCAFAAGRAAGRRVVRRWQMAFTATAALLLAGFPLVWHGSQQVADRQLAAAPTGAGRRDPTERGDLSEKIVTNLDAWQSRHDEALPLKTALEEFKNIDSHSRTLSVAALTRTLERPQQGHGP